MKIDLKNARPWPDIDRIFRNARSLAVVADGKRFDGDAELEIDEFGNVTLTVGSAKSFSRRKVA